MPASLGGNTNNISLPPLANFVPFLGKIHAVFFLYFMRRFQFLWEPFLV